MYECGPMHPVWSILQKLVIKKSLKQSSRRQGRQINSTCTFRVLVQNQFDVYNDKKNAVNSAYKEFLV